MKLWKRKEESKYNRFIRERIIQARKEKGMTQEELAKELYTSREVIANIETGRTEVSAVDLMGIAYILEKPIIYFFPLHIPTENELSGKEWELIHYFRKLGSETMENLLIHQAKEFARVSEETIEERIRKEHRIADEEHEGIDFNNPEEIRQANLRTLERIEREIERKPI